MRISMRDFVSRLLIISLFFSATVAPSAASVYGADEEPSEPTSPQYTEEQLSKLLTEDDVVEKGEDYTVFELPDGSNVMQMYTSNIRIEEEDGSLSDVDNSIEEISAAGGTAYTNVNGFVDVTLPETLAPETPVSFRAGGNVISFLPVFEEYGPFLEAIKAALAE